MKNTFESIPIGIFKNVQFWIANVMQKNPFLWIPSLLEALILINSRSQEKHETKFSGGRKNCENNLVFTRLHGEITKMELTLSMKN